MKITIIMLLYRLQCNPSLLGIFYINDDLFFRLLESVTMSELVDRYIDSIKTSVDDPWKYKGLVLKNGLNVLLIKDPDTEYSAASLSLAVGMFEITHNLIISIIDTIFIILYDI